MKNENTIRALRGKLLNDDFLTLATLLVKAGYTVRICSEVKPGAKTRETVLVFEEPEEKEKDR